jgi:hypothetical protein
MPAPGRAQDPGALARGTLHVRESQRGPRLAAALERRRVPRLWLYNLHYFEYLCSLPYESAGALILDWIARHPLARGNAGWEPYPTSLRLVAWCAWLFAAHRAQAEPTRAARSGCGRRSGCQAEWLRAPSRDAPARETTCSRTRPRSPCRRLLRGPGERWLAQGSRGSTASCPSRCSPTASTSSARRCTTRASCTCSSCSRRRASPSSRARRGAAARRARGAGQLCHPDGEIALLNDAAFGIAPPPRAGRRAAPDGAFALRDAGYLRRARGGHYVVCDAGPIGPTTTRARARRPALVRALARGRRVIVDAGVHGYDGDPLRAWCRSTRAHNTVEIDGEDQCEFWARFRVARRARPRDVVVVASTDGFRLSAWHDGYERLPGRPRHERAFRWHATASCSCATACSASGPCARCRAAPASRLRDRGARERARASGTRAGRSDRVRRRRRARREASTYCPEFGRARRRALAFTPRARATFGFCIAHGEARDRYDLRERRDG